MPKEIQVVFTGGDIAWNIDRVYDMNGQFDEEKSVGGSVYYCAIGARAALRDLGVGVVGNIGEDFPLDHLCQRGIDITGVKVSPQEPTAQFLLEQFPGNKRKFSAVRGAAEHVDTTIFPDTYRKAQYIHLSTGLPQHQMEWIKFFQNNHVPATLSADTFEQFVLDHPEKTRSVLAQIQLMFINEDELDYLREQGEVSYTIPTILKRGSQGAVYIENDYSVSIPAPAVTAVETTGAGDVLAGAFLALRSADMPIDKELEHAVAIASESVTKFGIEHILSYE